MPELTLSVNSFVPKPWTPFQYVGYGGQMPEARSVSAGAMHAVRSLKEKIKHLRQGLAGFNEACAYVQAWNATPGRLTVASLSHTTVHVPGCSTALVAPYIHNH